MFNIGVLNTITILVLTQLIVSYNVSHSSKELLKSITDLKEILSKIKK